MRKDKFIKFMSITTASLLLAGVIIGVCINGINSKANDIDTEKQFEEMTDEEINDYMNNEDNVINLDGKDEKLDHSEEIEADEELNKYDANSVLMNTRGSQEKTYTIPGGKGTLISNVWLQEIGTISGATRQWDYQSSAKYKGNKKVHGIKTAWTIHATMRNCSTLSVTLKSGEEGGEFSASKSSEWQNIKTREFYFLNTKGQKESSYRSNFIITPWWDYKLGSCSIINRASLVLENDKKIYRIQAGI